MNGIDPPRPLNIGGAPKYAPEARWTESSSQAAVAGASQPSRAARPCRR